MSVESQVKFEDSDLIHYLDTLPRDSLDSLAFGVIGFDRSGVVKIYNTFESKAAGLPAEKVLDLHIFESVAPCMNNFMVAQRFDDALAKSAVLDVVIDYVLTLRMRPIKVKLRLMSNPAVSLRFVLVQRSLS